MKSSVLQGGLFDLDKRDKADKNAAHEMHTCITGHLDT